MKTETKKSKYIDYCPRSGDSLRRKCCNNLDQAIKDCWDELQEADDRNHPALALNIIIDDDVHYYDFLICSAGDDYGTNMFNDLFEDIGSKIKTSFDLFEKTCSMCLDAYETEWCIDVDGYKLEDDDENE